MNTPKIGIIIGSPTDGPKVEPIVHDLKRLGIGYDFIVASAHRTPLLVQEWTAAAEAKGIRVIIAAAGAAAALPGVVAAHTLLPVIGLPVNATPMQGMDALVSIVQMPPGVAVATVGIDNWKNALNLALRILALSDTEIKTKLEREQEEMVRKQKEKATELEQKLNA